MIIVLKKKKKLGRRKCELGRVRDFQGIPRFVLKPYSDGIKVTFEPN